MTKFVCGAVLDGVFSSLVDVDESTFLQTLDALRTDRKQHFKSGQHTHVAAIEVVDDFDIHNWNLDFAPTGVVGVVALVSRDLEIIVRPSIKIKNAYCKSCGGTGSDHIIYASA